MFPVLEDKDSVRCKAKVIRSQGRRETVSILSDICSPYQGC